MDQEALSEKELQLFGFLSYIKSKERLTPGQLLIPVIKHCVFTLQKTQFNTEEIRTEAVSHFGKEFPIIVIQRMLAQLVVDQQIIRDEKGSNNWICIANGENYLEAVEHAKRSMTYFYRTFSEFLSKKDASFRTVKHATIVRRIRKYCEECYAQIAPFLVSGIPPTPAKDTEMWNTVLWDFVRQRVDTDPELKLAFAEIFTGALLLTLFERIGEQFDNFREAIGEKVLYLDTNVLLRILGLQDAFLNRLGAEFHSILREYHIELRVWDRTVHELESLVRGYRFAEQYLRPDGKVSHLYQYLKDQEVKPYELVERIAAIKKSMSDLGVTIDNHSTLNAENSVLLESKLEQYLALKKAKKISADAPDQYIPPERLEALVRHDLRCLLLLDELRQLDTMGNNDFTDTKYFFVTSDSLLLRQQAILQREAFTGVPLALSDSALSFLLYLHRMDTARNIATESFTLAHFNNQTLSLGNWIAFVDESNRKFKAGKIDKKGLGFLLGCVSLRDYSFRIHDVEHIVNAAIAEYEKWLSESSQEKETLTGRVNNLEGYVDNLVQKYDETASAHAETKGKLESGLNELSSLRKEIDLLKKIVYVFCAAVLVLGMLTAFNGSPIIGGVSSLLALLTSVLNYFDLVTRLLRRLSR